jgi:hypothetical protein
MPKQRKFIIDATELLKVMPKVGVQIQPVKLAIVATEDAEGYLVIEHMRASSSGTVEDLSGNTGLEQLFQRTGPRPA